jgi:hypothetical protein
MINLSLYGFYRTFWGVNFFLKKNFWKVPKKAYNPFSEPIPTILDEKKAFTEFESPFKGLFY